MTSLAIMTRTRVSLADGRIGVEATIMGPARRLTPAQEERLRDRLCEAFETVLERELSRGRACRE